MANVPCEHKGGSPDARCAASETSLQLGREIDDRYEAGPATIKLQRQVARPAWATANCLVSLIGDLRAAHLQDLGRGEQASALQSKLAQPAGHLPAPLQHLARDNAEERGELQLSSAWPSPRCGMPAAMCSRRSTTRRCPARRPVRSGRIRPCFRRRTSTNAWASSELLLKGLTGVDNRPTDLQSADDAALVQGSICGRTSGRLTNVRPFARIVSTLILGLACSSHSGVPCPEPLHDALFTSRGLTPRPSRGTSACRAPCGGSRSSSISARYAFVQDRFVAKACRSASPIFSSRCVPAGASLCSIYLLFEHQSSPDRFMPFRHLVYMVPNLLRDWSSRQTQGTALARGVANRCSTQLAGQVHWNVALAIRRPAACADRR